MGRNGNSLLKDHFQNTYANAPFLLHPLPQMREDLYSQNKIEWLLSKEHVAWEDRVLGGSTLWDINLRISDVHL